MDMIEHAIHCLGFQAEGIAKRVPNSARTTELLLEAAEALHRAAGERHEHRALATDLDDDFEQAQRAQLAQVEAELGLVINKEPFGKN
ncbi:MAG: hypothetical protein GEU88_20505 [Solirubrobacterales bacterium]|nr:hypothetical protein [Solirubrobacterales bacterium]